MILKESYKEFCTSSWNRKKRPSNQQQKVECYAEQAVRMIEDILTKNFVPQVEIEKKTIFQIKLINSFHNSFFNWSTAMKEVINNRR